MQIYVLYIHCIYDNGIMIHDQLALNNNYYYTTVMIFLITRSDGTAALKSSNAAVATTSTMVVKITTVQLELLLPMVFIVGCLSPQ